MPAHLKSRQSRISAPRPAAPSNGSAGTSGNPNGRSIPAIGCVTTALGQCGLYRKLAAVGQAEFSQLQAQPRGAFDATRLFCFRHYTSDGLATRSHDESTDDHWLNQSAPEIVSFVILITR